MRTARILTLGIAVLAGCSTNSPPKTSHFDHDHAVAPYWPDSLADAAVKLRARLEPDFELQHGHGQEQEHGHGHGHGQEHGREHEHEHGHGHGHGHGQEQGGASQRRVGDEIADLVSWVPEIAADTNLSEQDWIPLDNAAAALAANLRASGNALTESNRAQVRALCELIEQSVQKIPTQFP